MPSSMTRTVILVLLILEVARPAGQRFTKALAAEIVVAKELDVKPEDIDKAVREAATEVT